MKYPFKRCKSNHETIHLLRLHKFFRGICLTQDYDDFADYADLIL